jgi:hypothetical protein
MSAIAGVGQSCADIIEAKLDSQAQWLKVAHDRMVRASEDEYRGQLDNFRSERHRYFALYELARECGLRD